MARQRFIWPDLWTDPELGRVSERALLLYIGCFSMADDDGRLYGDPTFLRSEIFRYRRMTEAQILAARDELEAACSAFFVYQHREIDYIALLNWRRWQKPKYPRPSKLPAPPRAAQRQWERQNLSGNHSAKPSGALPEPFQEPSGNDSSVGWDGLGSTPHIPPKRANRRRSRSTAQDAPTQIGFRQAWARFVTGVGWDETYSAAMVEEELERILASRQVLDDGTLSRTEALELWQVERDRRYSEIPV